MVSEPVDGAASAAVPGPAVPPVPPVLSVAPPVLNVANVLTVSRLLLVPVFLVALFVGDGHQLGWRLVAGVIFAIASITDHVDGNLARSRNLVTDFGKIADPIADKALTGSALVGLSLLGDLSWWVTVVIAVREIGITLLRFWVIRYGVIAASPGGKAKTLVQVIAIGLFVLPLPTALWPLLWALMGVAVALTVITGVDYVVRAVRLRRSGLAAARSAAKATEAQQR
ncbi:MAG TPA: CDP-diacylglycerol--glycerol-3-phosphate 3-phosphatidyltransferase [Pseudonocardiaceae bacterium]|jgi:CDP-diacylglycerol--glycerol-3-phosphate 3-phosphatidyltransferase|nr:CDP-diacylglycerol--glycerol-3-phosphate 3-phosphatidyltransferase [Pseudonocardiaceae bacterium]